ncbi:hypothetical protein OQA88_7082 [Cercophora sp. LCS_1]
MAAMDPRFTHGQLVGALVESLGLSPDVFRASATLRPPSRSADAVHVPSAVPSWAMPVQRWSYPDHDRDHIPSSESSLLGLDHSGDDAGAHLAARQPPKPLAGHSIITGTTYRGAGYADVLEWMQATPAAYLPRKVPASSARTRDGPPAIPPLSTKPRVGYPGDARPSPASHASVSGSATPPAAPNPPPSTTVAPPLGPCSKVWELPPRIRRRKKIKPESLRAPAKQKRDPRQVAELGPKRRGAYTDETKKRNTALTRILKSCIRCRMNRGRCNPDPEDPFGSCLTCKRITGPTLCKMPCYRYIITDASLYREQRAPFQLYTRRWQSMDMVNIAEDGWASPEVRIIEVSPNHIYAPFKFRVREFVPVDGDLLEEQWTTAHGKQTIALPRYAVVDMHETATEMKEYIERNISNFIAVTVGHLDQLLWETYTTAFRHIGTARTPEERSLLTNALRLWVTCRLISNPVHVCGDDKLGGHAVYSPDSLHNGKVPMPVIVTAQFECINYTTFLRPWSKAVLKQLNELVLAKKREYWLSIYYAMFVLLHSCSMMTRRDAETAEQYDMKTQYANPESIKAHHSGAQTMLAHFHFINKGVIPFSLPHNEAGKQELAKAANLTEDEIAFVWRTARMINEPERAARMKHARDAGAVGDDLYWISMLYDREWIPQAND